MNSMEQIKDFIILFNSAIVFMIALLGWFLKRYVSQTDTRLERAEKEAVEIRRNYIRRFEEVHDSLEEKTDQIKEHFNRKIEEVVVDKTNWRMQQVRDMTEMRQDLKHISEHIKNNNRP